jgi:hypothetical protein
MDDDAFEHWLLVGCRPWMMILLNIGSWRILFLTENL